MFARKPSEPPAQRAPAKPKPKSRANVSYSAELIRWDPAFALDYGQIDEEHRKITRLLNLLYADWMGSHGRLSPIRVLEELNTTMVRHFLHEESVMQENKCPHLNEHKVVHRLFVRDLREIGALLRAGVTDIEVKPQLLAFTRRLVVDHVLTMDHDMAKYMR
ncbi:MAG: hemerythrin family protein [Magnetospirillum sp.]|nr:hemerythrin family protein [Magnetospirillum sp.]